MVLKIVNDCAVIQVNELCQRTKETQKCLVWYLPHLYTAFILVLVNYKQDISCWFAKCKDVAAPARS